MNRSRRSRIFGIAFAGLPVLAIVLAATPGPAFADDDGAQGPDPGVARVSIIAGGVDVKRGDSGDTVAAAVNAPLSPGDYLSTREDSHAEVQFDYGTDLRVGPNTQLRFTQLDPKNHQLQLAAGTVDLRVAYGLTANAQIQTPQATIQPDENGNYVVNVDDQGNSQVTARSGRVDVISQAGTQTIVPGSTLAITGDVDHPQFRSVETVAYEGFDSWIASRDAVVASASDDRYIQEGMVGAGDLDQNGSWVEYPQYGRVWVPAVAAGWAPYHDGRWVWEPHYGWTWVDNEPWGWAPFHYGNWFYAANVGWAWYPGAYAVARPYVYRPALVAFFNFGGGGGNFSVGFGNVGWVPIAPYEPFHPWWGGRSTVAYNTTIVNNTTIINNYTNLHAPGGIVGVTNRNFASGNFAGVRTLEPVEIRGAEPIRGVLPIVPTQRNLALRDHENGFRPLQPVARFGTFRTQPQIVGPDIRRATSAHPNGRRARVSARSRDDHALRDARARNQRRARLCAARFSHERCVRPLQSRANARRTRSARSCVSRAGLSRARRSRAHVSRADSRNAGVPCAGRARLSPRVPRAVVSPEPCGVAYRIASGTHPPPGEAPHLGRVNPRSRAPPSRRTQCVGYL